MSKRLTMSPAVEKKWLELPDCARAEIERIRNGPQPRQIIKPRGVPESDRYRALSEKIRADIERLRN